MKLQLVNYKHSSLGAIPVLSFRVSYQNLFMPGTSPWEIPAFHPPQNADSSLNDMPG
jgi:hypothetical protein